MNLFMLILYFQEKLEFCLTASLPVLNLFPILFTPLLLIPLLPTLLLILLLTPFLFTILLIPLLLVPLLLIFLPIPFYLSLHCCTVCCVFTYLSPVLKTSVALSICCTLLRNISWCVANALAMSLIRCPPFLS